MYEERLGNAGYLLLKLARTNNRGDGKWFFSLAITIGFVKHLMPITVCFDQIHQWSYINFCLVVLVDQLQPKAGLSTAQAIIRVTCRVF